MGCVVRRDVAPPLSPRTGLAIPSPLPVQLAQARSVSYECGDATSEHSSSHVYLVPLLLLLEMPLQNSESFTTLNKNRKWISTGSHADSKIFISVYRHGVINLTTYVRRLFPQCSIRHSYSLIPLTCKIHPLQDRATFFRPPWKHPEFTTWFFNSYITSGSPRTETSRIYAE